MKPTSNGDKYCHNEFDYSVPDSRSVRQIPSLILSVSHKITSIISPVHKWAEVGNYGQNWPYKQTSLPCRLFPLVLNRTSL